MAINLWPTVEHALAYLAEADQIPHRTEGEAELLAHLPADVDAFVDLGCGDGRLAALVRTAHPDARATAFDFSPPMLEAARERFAAVPEVTVIAHDLDVELPLIDPVDAIVSSFAIHHVDDDRKRALTAEVFERLLPGGVFLNLEHVASPTERLHDAFLAELGIEPAEDDPSNQLAPVAGQLRWMRDAGFVDVDCHWKWRELALLGGTRP
jgi:tRNA (cmo5U34)-methyltransferase